MRRDIIKKMFENMGSRLTIRTGTSIGGLPPVGKQWDVGVDNNKFYPVSFDQLVEIMKINQIILTYLKKLNK